MPDITLFDFMPDSFDLPFVPCGITGVDFMKSGRIEPILYGLYAVGQGAFVLWKMDRQKGQS